MKLELALQMGLAKLGIEVPPGLCVGAQRVEKEGVLAAADGLRLVERHVDIAISSSVSAPSAGSDGNAGTGAHEGGRTGDVERRFELSQHRPDDVRDPPGIAAIREKENELVAAQPEDARSAADDGQPAVGDLLEQRVSAEWPIVSLTSLNPSRSNRAIDILTGPSPSALKNSSSAR